MLLNIWRLKALHNGKRIDYGVKCSYCVYVQNNSSCFWTSIVFLNCFCLEQYSIIVKCLQNIIYLISFLEMTVLFKLQMQFYTKESNLQISYGLDSCYHLVFVFLTVYWSMFPVWIFLLCSQFFVFSFLHLFEEIKCNLYCLQQQKLKWSSMNLKIDTNPAWILYWFLITLYLSLVHRYFHCIALWTFMVYFGWYKCNVTCNQGL